MTPITVGAYRSGDEPMLVVSGAMGKHGLDITQWLLWFWLTLEDAIDTAQARTSQGTVPEIPYLSHTFPIAFP